MRAVDEILWSFPGQPADARRYLVRRLERQPITVDAAVPWSLLRQAEGSEVADYARLAEDVFFSRREEDRVRRAGGDPPKEAGNWTRYLGQDHEEGPEVEGEDLERAATACLAPLVPALARQLQEGGRRASLGVKVLSRIRVPESLAAVKAIAGVGANASLCVAAYSLLGGEEAAAHALELARARAGTPVFPGMVHALRGVPTAEVLAFLAETAERTPRVGSQVASALEGFEGLEYQPVLDRLITQAKDPWCAIHAVETMGRVGGKELLPRVATILQKVDHPLVQVVCLQALAEARVREGAKLAVAALGSKYPTVQAAAVEALIRLPVAKQEFGDRVLQLLDTPHPKLAMNVALACVILDPRRATRRVKELLGSGNPQQLLQGIHCLAYMDYPQAAGILRAVVLKAAPGPMRIQAVRALGRRSVDDPQAVQPLLQLLELDDAAVRQTAAWFLAGAHPSARKAVARVLVEALGREPHLPTAAVMAEALGLLGPDAADASGALGKLLEGGGPRAPAAAWALAVAFPDSPAAKGLAASRTPTLRAHGVLARWVGGDTDLGELVGLLGARNDEAFEAAASVAREVAESAVFADGATRLRPLARSLAALLQESAAGPVVDVDEAPAGEATARAAEISGTPSVREMGKVVASGRRGSRDAYGGGEVHVKTGGSPAAMGASALVSEEDAAAAVAAAEQASQEGMDAAVRNASYFADEGSTQGGPAVPASRDPGVLQGGAPQEAGAPASSAQAAAVSPGGSRGAGPVPRGTFLRTAFFYGSLGLLAVAFGRLARYLWLGHW